MKFLHANLKGAMKSTRKLHRKRHRISKMSTRDDDTTRTRTIIIIKWQHLVINVLLISKILLPSQHRIPFAACYQTYLDDWKLFTEAAHVEQLLPAWPSGYTRRYGFGNGVRSTDLLLTNKIAVAATATAVINLF